MGEKAFPAFAEAAFAVGKAVSGAVCRAEVQECAVSALWRRQFALCEIVRAFLRENRVQRSFTDFA